jgi:TusA-related sulfurtransferase
MIKANKHISTVGTCCPMPLVIMAEAIAEMKPGPILSVTGDDPICESRMRDYCSVKGFELLDVISVPDATTLFVRIS